jgi:hypothetical protein
VFGALAPMLLNAAAGIAAGAIVYAVLAVIGRVRTKWGQGRISP